MVFIMVRFEFLVLVQVSPAFVLKNGFLVLFLFISLIYRHLLFPKI